MLEAHTRINAHAFEQGDEVFRRQVTLRAWRKGTAPQASNGTIKQSDIVFQRGKYISHCHRAGIVKMTSQNLRTMLCNQLGYE
tara:strand:- start:28 stop:276 length:249 start_codon:yes stop_codon:yes gene_type:complete